MHCFSIRCMPSRQFYNVYESIWNTITLHDSGVKLFPNYLHIHVASGFNSKTTELAKNTIARWNESSSVSRLDEDINWSSFSLHSGGLHSSEKQETCEIEFSFWSLRLGWTLAATGEGLDRCRERDQNKSMDKTTLLIWSRSFTQFKRTQNASDSTAYVPVLIR